MNPRETLFEQGLAAYEAGEYYDAHEKWEEIWNDEDDDAHRRFLQALIQVTSAVHKAMNNAAPRGALRLLSSALEKIADLPDPFGGIAIDVLRTDISRFASEVERALSNNIETLDLSTIPRVVKRGQGIVWRARNDAALPDASRTFREGVAAYQRKAFYEAHEHWEALWRIEPEGPRKRFLQGIIQVAAALHKLYSMKSAAGAIRLFERSRAHLTPIPDGMGGLSVKALLADIDRVLAELPTLVAASRTDLPEAFIPALTPAAN